MTSPAAGAGPERLTAKQRQDRIVSLVSGEVFLDVGRLSDRLAVTPQTIRRDLRHLAQSGRLQRHHGGAPVASSTVNIGYGERQAIHHVAKQAIARIAAARIPDGASLFINIGTTTEAVAHALQSRRNLRVMTNNLHVAMRLSRFCQFLADIIGVPVQRPAMLESTALGAAVLAGLATGLFASLEDSSAQRAQGRCFTPAMPAVQRKTLLAGWHAAVRLALPATNTQGTEQA